MPLQQITSKLLIRLNNSYVRGHYAEVFKDKDSVFITKRAVAITVRENDSIYIHADTLKITGKPEHRILKGFYKARFFKRGLPDEEPTSGKCDSIFVNERTGITKLLRNPILWSWAKSNDRGYHSFYSEISKQTN